VAVNFGNNDMTMIDKDKAILDLYKCLDSFVGELTNIDPYYDPPSCHEEIETAFKILKEYEPLISEIQQAWPEEVKK